MKDSLRSFICTAIALNFVLVGMDIMAFRYDIVAYTLPKWVFIASAISGVIFGFWLFVDLLTHKDKKEEK